MDKLDIQEKLLGGIFGVISIAAAVAETIAGGIDAAAIFGMIKDISGTLVVVVVMLAVAKMLAPKKYKKSFEDRFNAALDEWVENNSNMIVHSEKMNKNSDDEREARYGLGMKTDMNEFYDSGSSSGIGWFVRMPVIKEKFYNYSISETDKSRTGAVIEFHMNKSTFCGTNGKATDTEWSEKSAKLGKQFAGYINRKFSDFAKAVTASGDIIKVSILQPVYTDEDISRLIDLINTMYNAYLVASHIEVK